MLVLSNGKIEMLFYPIERNEMLVLFKRNVEMLVWVNANGWNTCSGQRKG